MNFSLEINSTVISTVVANDKAVSKLKGVNSKNTDAINKTKLQTIAHLSADLADETRFPRNKKGKTVFGKNVSSGIKLQLSDAGIKDANNGSRPSCRMSSGAKIQADCDTSLRASEPGDQAADARAGHFLCARYS